MPKRRVRFNGAGKALPCSVRLPPSLAVALYAARLRGSYKDETELVCSIVREWAARQPAAAWPDVLEQLRREESDDSEEPKSEGP